MSKDDYARLLIHAPTKLVLALIVAFSGGIGWTIVYSPGGGDEQAERDLHSCLVAYAESRSISFQYEQDIDSLRRWASETIATLGEIQRLEALRRAPRVYTSAAGFELSR